MKKRFLKSLSVMLSLILVLMATVGVFVTNSVALAGSQPTYYVASEAAGGSDDNNNGLTASAPLLTIKKAIELANESYGSDDTVVIKTVGSGAVTSGHGATASLPTYKFKKLVITANDTSVPGTISGDMQLGGETEFSYITVTSQGNENGGNGFTFAGYSATFGENAYLGALGGQYNTTLAWNVGGKASTAPINVKINQLNYKAFYFSSNRWSWATYNHPITIEINNWSAAYTDELYGGFNFSHGNCGNTTFNAPLNIKVDQSNIRLVFKSNTNKTSFGNDFALQVINSTGKDIAKTGDYYYRNNAITESVHASALDTIDATKKYIIHNATGTKDALSFTSVVGEYKVNVDPDITVVATSLKNRKEIYKAVGGTTLMLPAGEYRLTSEKTPKRATYYIKTDLNEVVEEQSSNLSLDGNDATTYNADSARDDAPYIQNLVDTAVAGADGIKVVEVPEVNPADGTNLYQIGTTIELPSNTTVILNNCTLRLNDGVLCNIFASEGLHIRNQKAADELHNIKITGLGNATLDGGNHNGVTETSGTGNVKLNHFIWFKNVDGFEISNLTMIEQRHWAICFNFCENGEVFNIHFDCLVRSENVPNQDGIDLRNGCNNIVIHDITGNTGDDTIAMTNLYATNNYDYIYRIADKDFAIHDIEIYNIATGVNGGHGLIRLLAHNGMKIYNVDIKNVEDKNTHMVQGAIRIADTAFTNGGTPMAYGDIDNVTIDGVVSYGHYAIYAGSSNVTTEHVTYKNIRAVNGRKYTNLTIADTVVPISDLSGTTIYNHSNGDLSNLNHNCKTALIPVDVQFNGASTKYTIKGLNYNITNNNAPLQFWTPKFTLDTTGYNQLRAQIRIAEIYENDAPTQNIKLYYSTDNGATWSEEPVALNKAYHGEILTLNDGTKCKVWSYTSADLSTLTDKPITNVMIRPYGDQNNLIQGAIRLISLDVKGVEKDYDLLRDDAPYIQSLIDNAEPNADGIKVVNVPSVNGNYPADGNLYRIGSAIEIPSNTTINLADCKLRLNDGVLTNVFVSKDLHTKSDMTEADELENIKIIGNGNVEFDGGIHNGVTENTPGAEYLNTFIWFRNVSGFEISGLKFIEQRYWALRFNFCDNGKLYNLDFDCGFDASAPNQDGIDLRNGCHDIEIYNITGDTGDDTIALTNLTIPGSDDVLMEVDGKSTDIYNIKIHDVEAAVNGYHSLVRLLAHHGNKIYDVDIKNITDVSTTVVQGVLRIGDTNFVIEGSAMKYGDITRVTVDNVYSKGAYAIYAPNWNVSTDHVKYNNIAVARGCKYVYLRQAGEAAALAPLTGTTIYKYTGGDTTNIIHNSNFVLPLDVVLNEVSTKFTIWPLDVDRIANNEHLQISTPDFTVETTDFDDVRLQVQAAVCPDTDGNDPSLQNLAVYYSIDNGTTWSAEPIALTKAFHGKILFSADQASLGTPYDVWSFTSGDISGLTDKDITNLKVCPYGEQNNLIAGAFRLISIDVVGSGQMNEVGKGDGSFENPFATVAEAIAAANDAGFVEGDFVTAIVVGKTPAQWGNAEDYSFNLTVKSYDNDNLSTVNPADIMTGNVEFSNITLDTPNNRIMANGHSVTMGENAIADGYIIASAQNTVNTKAQTITFNNNNSHAIVIGNHNQNGTVFEKDVNYVLNNSSAKFNFQFMAHYGGGLGFRKNLNFNVRAADSLTFGETTIDANGNVWAGTVAPTGAAQIIMPYNTNISDNSLANFRTITNHYIIKNLTTTVEDLLGFVEEAAGEYEVIDDFVVAAYNEADERVAASENGYLNLKDKNLEFGTYHIRLIGAHGHNLCDDIRDLVYVNEVMEGGEEAYTELVDKDNTYAVTDEDKEIMHQELLTGKKYFPAS